MERVLTALRVLRAPIARGEYDLHGLVRAALTDAGLEAEHEVPLAPRCRIDFLCGGVGIEIKRGKPNRTAVRAQLARYAACAAVEAIVLVSESTIDLPGTIGGKPVRLVCLNRLWGIAL